MCSVNVAIQTGALPSKVRVVGSNLLPGNVSLFLHFFPYTARLPRCMRVCGEGPARVSGLLTIDFDQNIPVVVYEDTYRWVFENTIVSSFRQKEQGVEKSVSGKRSDRASL